MRARILYSLVAVGSLCAGGDWSQGDKERFLLTAQIVSEQPIGIGLTHSTKAILSDGRRTHAAHVQTVDIHQALFRGKDGSEEADFKDSWKFNVAAYRLARLLRLSSMVPVTVARVVDRKPAAVDWWIDDVLMDERARLAQHISPPDVARWNRQMQTIRVFDQLIYNMDRSQENLLITRNWDVWMIDHSRAFRKWRSLRNPAAITECSPDLREALERLRREDVARELGPFLTEEEIDGLMARRDLILTELRQETAEHARAAVR